MKFYFTLILNFLLYYFYGRLFALQKSGFRRSLWLLTEFFNASLRYAKTRGINCFSTFANNRRLYRSILLVASLLRWTASRVLQSLPQSNATNDCSEFFTLHTIVNCIVSAKTRNIIFTDWPQLISVLTFLRQVLL